MPSLWDGEAWVALDDILDVGLFTVELAVSKALGVYIDPDETVGSILKDPHRQGTPLQVLATFDVSQIIVPDSFAELCLSDLCVPEEKMVFKLCFPVHR